VDPAQDSIGSSKVIDYRVRAAKQIERRIIAEVLNQLVLMGGGPAHYRYIGMGSIAFMDFQLFHRVIGLRDMLSIEHEKHADRAQFNQPLACIQVLPGEAHDVLPTLDLTGRPILWLDYDGKLSDSMLDDAALCARKLEKGAVLMVTVNCESGKKPQGEVANVKNRIKATRLPTGFGAPHLVGWKYADFIRSMFVDEMQAVMAVRNTGKAFKDRLQFRQFLYFAYRDNARMCTIGWIFDAAEGTKVLESAKIDKLEAYRPGADHFLINPPVITPVETRHVNRQLPSARGAALVCPGLSKEELDEYAKLYRHYPMFYEVTEA
jgi:hypothetical protein